MIEAVTFDFWNTIGRVPPGAMTEARRRAIAAACEELAIEVEAGVLTRSLQAVGLSWEESWSAGRHMHPREGAEALTRALGLEGEAMERVAAAFLGAGREVPLELAPDIGSCLEALAQHGVRLGIVCDVGFTSGKTLRELLAREGLMERFDGWAFSDEVGHYKPAPQIFEAALRALGAAPAEALHVGDLRRTDVAGAAALGMRTARYRGMHDDPGGGAEAELVLDGHRQLPDLIARLGRG